MIGRYILSYSVRDIANNTSNIVTRTVRVEAWEQLVLDANLPNGGGRVSAVTTSNGDIFLVTKSSDGEYLDAWHLPYNTHFFTQLKHGLSYATPSGFYGMAVSRNGTTPYIGFAFEGENSLLAYNNGTYNLITPPSCASNSDIESSFKGITVGSNGPIMLLEEYYDKFPIFYGLCNGTQPYMEELQRTPITIKYDAQDTIYWANQNNVYRLFNNGTNYSINPAPTLPGSGNNKSICFDMADYCQILRTTTSGFGIYKLTTSGWELVGGETINVTGITDIQMVTDGNMLYVAYQIGSDFPHIMKYDMQNEEWVTFSKITYGNVLLTNIAYFSMTVNNSDVNFVYTTTDNKIRVIHYKPQ